jgi:hypothetical protein
MKKLLKFCAILIAISAIYQTSWSGYRSLEGETLQTYNRFHKGGNSEFNPWGLLSPLQNESQVIIHDTLRFKHRVIYPVAPHFNLVEPSYSPEAKVAKEIMNVILDSLRRVAYDFSFDYDGQSFAVRQHVNPKTLKPDKPSVDISLLGTSSPEAIRYGLTESLSPGKYEDENANLAKERLLRTYNILKEEISNDNVDFDIYFSSLNSEELQLKSQSEVEKAILDPSILNKMRYVDADISIITQKVKIDTTTAPIALPIWAALLYFLLWKIYRWMADAPRRRYSRKNLPSKNSKIIWWILVAIAAIVAYAAILSLLPLWLIILISIIYLLYALYIVYKYSNFSMFWIRLFATTLEILDYIIRALNWWKKLCRCCRFFIILSFIILLLWATGVMHVTFVWPF